MHRLKCECGSESFRVNRRCSTVQCLGCFKSYDWNGEAWVLLKKKTQAVRLVKSIVFKPVEIVYETIGQIRKRLGIKKIRKRDKPLAIATEMQRMAREIMDQTEYTLSQGERRELKLKRLFTRWQPYISRLKEKEIFIDANEHFGSLRGRDIARAAHRDLARLGIKTRLTFTKRRSAKLEVV